MLPQEDRYTPPVLCAEIREASTNKQERDGEEREQDGERGDVEDALEC